MGHGICSCICMYVHIHAVVCMYTYMQLQNSVHDTMFTILIYIQQDATLHSLFYLETALHILGGTITHHQECKQLNLQHLVFVTQLLLSADFVEESEPV